MKGSVNDFPDTLLEYRGWLERRSEHWVLKSPDHVANLPRLLDVFPEARFLICLREAGATLASTREYWQLTGVGPEYNIIDAVKDLVYWTEHWPEKFDWINVHTIPEWESDREPQYTKEAEQINQMYDKIRGNCTRVDSRQFKERYRIKIQGA